MANSFLRKRKGHLRYTTYVDADSRQNKMAMTPWRNHSWHITLHITPTGLSTLDMPYQNKHFQIDFDFISQRRK